MLHLATGPNAGQGAASQTYLGAEPSQKNTGWAGGC